MLNAIVYYGTDLLAWVLPVSIAATNVVFFPLLAFWLLGGKFTLRQWPPQWGLYEKVFLVYVGVSLLSVCFGIEPRRGLSIVWKKDFYITIAIFLTAVVLTEEKNKRLLRIFMWAGALMAFWGLVQFVVGVNQSDKSGGYFYHLPAAVAHYPRPLLDLLSMVNGRVLGTRGHPLSYAECLLFNWAFGLSFLHVSEGKQRLQWLGYLALIGGALIVSQSRGPWLAAIVMALVTIIFTGVKRSGPLLILGALFIGLFRFTPSLYQRARSIADKTHHSNSDRIVMWKSGLTLFKYRPLLGVGPGGVKYFAHPFQDDTDRYSGPWGHLHNNYIHILAERGVLGLLAWLAFMLALCKEFWDGYRKSSTTYQKLFFSSAGLSMMGFFIGGLTETSYNSAVVMMTFYFVAGLALALSRHDPAKI